MVDPTLLSGAAAALELALNQTLSLDPGTQATLRTLEHKVVALEVDWPGVRLYLRLGYPLTILSDYDGPVDCGLRGSALGFVTLAASGYHNLATSGIEQSGDSSLLSQLLTIAQQLDIDWEQPLVKLLGDVPGYALAKHWRNQAQWLRQSANKAPFFIGDYLTHELGLIASAGEIADFCQQVDDTRAATDRLNARILQLQTHLPAGARPL